MTIKLLTVSIADTKVGRIERPDQYIFIYEEYADPSQAVSVTMPTTPSVYPWPTLHPIFAQNLPEGYLGDVIRRTVSKTVGSDDLSLLSVLGQHQIGRLRYALPDAVPADSAAGNTLSAADIIADPNPDLFSELFEKYYLRSGLAGIQPKVMLDATLQDKATLRTGGYIVKSWGDDFPELAANEFFCMNVAKAASVRTPRFDLSHNGKLFLMTRFDLLGDNQYRGFEDGCVLQGLAPRDKYEGSYERLAKHIKTFVSPEYQLDSLGQFFRSLLVSWAVRNGDAHLKNFGILYDSVTGTRRLAPAFDIVSTVPYLTRDVPALTLAGKKTWWSPKLLQEFGTRFCHLNNADIEASFELVRNALSGEIPRITHYIDTRPAFADVGNKMIEIFKQSATDITRYLNHH